MEIALSGFAQQFDTTASVDSARQRQQQDAQRQSSAGNNRAQERANQTENSRAENNQRSPANAENARIIDGEVLSSETQRVNSRDASSFFTRSSANQQPADQPDNRKVTTRQAVQTFEENENLIPADNELRQISGIIDTFV
ncbi:hypothetical protein MNBD_GAMMA08-1964 [hydrothermal vent metagenome]|uniref:Uncharacterized protein n=1 Tax=hydrothermal vent metagenome TaxID=652676 RepID=A0A3B0X701_9ZZZZ